jgi:hypothetical protein
MNCCWIERPDQTNAKTLGERQLYDDDNPISHEEKAILLVFHALGVPAGESVPTTLISTRLGPETPYGGVCF